MTRRAKLLIVINTSWNIVNFRMGLIRGLMAAGYDVVVAAPRDRFSDEIEPRLGCRYVELPIDGHSRSPTTDLRLLHRLFGLMRAERPDAFLGFTVKPNIFGSLAAHGVGVACVNNIAGLGSVFNEISATARIVVWLYRVALRRSQRVFFQNRDDLALFVNRGIVRPEQTGLLPGSGIDTTDFPASPKPPPDAGAPFTFLLVARLLKEKGLVELADATRALRRLHPHARVKVVGPLDPLNPAAITAAEMDGWVAEGLFDYAGVLDDVRPAVADADCVVLPSYYREGTPRALLEAASMGKPLITTDMPGCRDVVDDGVNGYLVPPRDAAALAARMIAMVEAPAATLAGMGEASRAKAVSQFDETRVLQSYLDALRSIGVVTRTAETGMAANIPSASRN